MLARLMAEDRMMLVPVSPMTVSLVAPTVFLVTVYAAQHDKLMSKGEKRSQLALSLSSSIRFCTS